MLSELGFASFFVYSPRGTLEPSRRSREMVDGFKRGRWHREAAERIAEDVFDLAGYLGPDVVLVPMPGSAPEAPGGLWVTVSICDALVTAGLGAHVERLLERAEAVEKSALISRGANRPSPERHYDSMRAISLTYAIPRITVVDDVITRGSTMLGAVQRLNDAYPDAEVRAFSLVRTMSGEEVEELIVPTEGSIAYVAGSNAPSRYP